MKRLWCEAALLPDGWARDVAIAIAADGRIASVVAGVGASPADERHAVVLPGMPNLHSHSFQRAMSGLTEARGATRDSFWTWRTLMYRFAQHLDPELLEAIATMAFVEMLEAGYTRVGEFHYVHQQPDGSPYDEPAAMAGGIAAAAGTAGIGLTLLPVFYAASNFGGQPPGAPQRRFTTTIDGYARLIEASEALAAGLPDAVVGVAPHSLRAVPPDLLDELVALRPAAPVHIHIAEQQREVDDCLAWSGRRPVEWLYDRQAVDARWCLVHATHVTPDERARIASSGAVVGLCPITEANLGDGIFPAVGFAEAGGRFGIGTDSNVSIELAGELRLLEYGQRLVAHERAVLATADASTGRALFERASLGGRQALGGGETGIAAGGAADLVALDTRDPRLEGHRGDALLDGWIFGGAPVRHVWRRGKQLVIDGRHPARDAAQQRFREAMMRLRDAD